MVVLSLEKYAELTDDIKLKLDEAPSSLLSKKRRG